MERQGRRHFLAATVRDDLSLLNSFRYGAINRELKVDHTDEEPYVRGQSHDYYCQVQVDSDCMGHGEILGCWQYSTCCPGHCACFMLLCHPIDPPRADQLAPFLFLSALPSITYTQAVLPSAHCVLCLT